MTEVAATAHGSQAATREPSAAPRTVVIWNPGAGGGERPNEDPAQRRAAIEAALRAHGVNAALYESESEADATPRLDRALEAGVSTIVVSLTAPSGSSSLSS